RHTRSKRDWSSDVCSSDLHDLASGSEVVGRRAKLRADGRGDVACREDAIERAVFRDEEARRLFADAMYSGKPVRWIAAEDGVVVIAVAGNRVLRADPRFVDLRELAHTAKGEKHPHVRILDEREQIAVSGHDLARSRHALGECGDDVLGLVAFRL